MGVFELYLKLGFKHIVDFQGFDHIIFIMVLCAGYSYTEFKKLIVLVTAFTVGHSITLALATLQIVTVPAGIVEFLIAVTILVTALANVIGSGRNKFIYLLTLFFGLIHGLGFSNYLRALMGKEETILTPLLAFNLGLEIGQILILVVNYAVLFIAAQLLKLNQKGWKTFISGAAFGIAVLLMIDNKFW